MYKFNTSANRAAALNLIVLVANLPFFFYHVLYQSRECVSKQVLNPLRGTLRLYEGGSDIPAEISFKAKIICIAKYH